MNEVVAHRNFAVAEMQDMATALASSQLFGSITPVQVFALMLIADADGLHPATVVREFDVIQGRPALKSQAALARFQKAGGRVEYIERTDERCTVRLTHPQGGAVTVTWDMARARREGLDQREGYKKRPGVMFQWRAIAEGVRAVFPACLNGQYLVEEVQDFEPRPEPISTPAVIVTEEPRKPRPIPEEKARELARRAAEAGFTDEQIRSALGDDLKAVTAPKAKAFFAIVEAEEAAYAERMAAESEPLEGEMP